MNTHVAAPKTNHGINGKCTWEYRYNRDERTWDWKVTIRMDPVIIQGSANTEAEASKRIKEHVAHAR